MPEKRTVAAARRDLAEGKSPSTAAGEFIKQEIDHVREGKHGAKNTKQAIAIGLSEARRAGVPIPRNPNAPKRKRAKTAKRSSARKRTAKKSTTRARAVKKALKRMPTRAASKRALSRQAKQTARKRGHAARSAAAKKAARTRAKTSRRKTSTAKRAKRSRR
jgi:hypothetical protein